MSSPTTSSTTQPIAPTSAPQALPPDVRHQIRNWYDRQLNLCAQKHGASWPHTRAWVQDYLKEELRRKLLAQGWRTKRDGCTSY